MRFICIAFFTLLFTMKVYAISLWSGGNNFYKPQLKVGEIITVRFSDKTILKYKIEQKNNNYTSKKGIKGSGEIFSFFPEAEAKENDNIKNSIAFNINNENNFIIKAKILEINNGYGLLGAENSIIVDGERYNLKLEGEFSLYDLEPDNSIFSTDIYNLFFQIKRENLKQDFIGEEDLIFQTNYSEIITNVVFDPTNNITNLQVVTNLSSFEIKLKGISEEKKKQLIFNYLNSIINQLFK